nr:hypothetical protein [Mesorhizobium huakuii]
MLHEQPLTLLLYPLPLATLFTQKTGTYAAFNIAHLYGDTAGLAYATPDNGRQAAP